MQVALSRGRSRGRRPSALEAAIVFALGGTALAVMVPAFARQLHASRFVEPVDGLRRMGLSAIDYARNRPVPSAFPPSAALTPATPPRGRCEIDPPDLWDGPTWRALRFRPVRAEEPHCFAFGFDSTPGAARSTFRGYAHGDLDGDGTTSTFEISGASVEGDPQGATLDPGMFVDSEVE